jgi:hypothetical protein
MLGFTSRKTQHPALLCSCTDRFVREDKLLGESLHGTAPYARFTAMAFDFVEGSGDPMDSDFSGLTGCSAMYHPYLDYTSKM